MFYLENWTPPQLHLGQVYSPKITQTPCLLLGKPPVQTSFIEGPTVGGSQPTWGEGTKERLPSCGLSFLRDYLPAKI